MEGDMSHHRMLGVAAIAASLGLASCHSQPGPRDVEESHNLVKEGVELNDAGKFPEAETKLRDAVSRDDKNAVAHLDLGIVLENKEDHDGAANEFTTAVRLDPKL